MTNNGYYKSFQAMRQNVREEKFTERRLRELQAEEDKTLAIWAKRQLRIEQEISTKQSPLQRARRLRNKRQEEISRIHSSSAEHKKKLSERSRMNSCHYESELETSLEKLHLVLPEGDITISRTSSSSSLPVIPVKSQGTLSQSRSTSLPTLFCSPTAPPCRSKRPSLPPIDQPVRSCCETKQTLNKQKLPPLKPNFWI